MTKLYKQKLEPGKDYIGVGGGVLIFNKNKEVLLMRRYNTRNEAGWWCKPGGGIDYGEKAVQAMKREIKEEVGISIDIWGILPNTDQILKKEKQHWLAVNYIANIKKGKPKIMEPDKCDKLEWFDINQLPKKLTQTTKEPVKDYLSGKFIRL